MMSYCMTEGGIIVCYLNKRYVRELTLALRRWSRRHLATATWSTLQYQCHTHHLCSLLFPLYLVSGAGDCCLQRLEECSLFQELALQILVYCHFQLVWVDGWLACWCWWFLVYFMWRCHKRRFRCWKQTNHLDRESEAWKRPLPSLLNHSAGLFEWLWRWLEQWACMWQHSSCHSGRFGLLGLWGEKAWSFLGLWCCPLEWTVAPIWVVP